MHIEYVKDNYYARFHDPSYHRYREIHFICNISYGFSDLCILFFFMTIQPIFIFTDMKQYMTFSSLPTCLVYPDSTAPFSRLLQTAALWCLEVEMTNLPSCLAGTYPGCD